MPHFIMNPTWKCLFLVPLWVGTRMGHKMRRIRCLRFTVSGWMDLSPAGEKQPGLRCFHGRVSSHNHQELLGESQARLAALTLHTVVSPYSGRWPFQGILWTFPRTVGDSLDVPSFPALPLLSKPFSFVIHPPSLSTKPLFLERATPHYRDTFIHTVTKLSSFSRSTEYQAIFLHMLWFLVGQGDSNSMSFG